MSFLNLTLLSMFKSGYFTSETLVQMVRVALILIIGIPLLKIATRLTVKVTRNKFSAQSETLIKRFVYYTGFLILIITVLNEFGFKLSALLGAAGIFGIAVGFAAQTSISNIISGIFLISEKPFAIGDTIEINGTIGSVLSIDLLSIKVKTPDNRFVRIPNENMLKSEVINITRFPVRRLNLSFNVAYSADLNKVIKMLQKVAEEEELALKEPAPLIQIESFAPSGINILFGVWGKQENIGELKNALWQSVKQRFEQAGIGIPCTYLATSGQAEWLPEV